MQFCLWDHAKPLLHWSVIYTMRWLLSDILVVVQKLLFIKTSPELDLSGKKVLQNKKIFSSTMKAMTFKIL